MTGVRRFAQWGLWFGGALVLLAAVLIGIDVLMRKFLARSIGGADELAGYALAIGTAWGLGGRARSTAPISASTRSTCCFRAGCGSRSTSPALVLFVCLLRPDRLAWLRRGDAVLDLGLAQPVGARDADGDAAGCSGSPGSSAFVVVGVVAARRCRSRLMSVAVSCAAVSQLIGTRSAEEEVEDEIRDLQERTERDGRA